MSSTFQRRRVVAVLGEGDAPASFAVEGMLTVVVDGNEFNKQHTQPATAEEVAQLFGDGHTAQLAIIADLTSRMTAQAVELDETKQKLGAAERKLASIKEADNAYDTQVKPLLQ